MLVHKCKELFRHFSTADCDTISYLSKKVLKQFENNL